MKKAWMTEKLFLVSFVIAAFIFFGINPKTDRLTWLLENIPVFVVLPIIIYLDKKIKWNPVTLRFLAFGAFMMMFGGWASFAENPFGYYLKDLFYLARNPYDRIGHYFQGVIPALVFTDLLKQNSKLSDSKLLIPVIMCFCLAIGIGYEFIELTAAHVMGEDAASFLAYQNDPEDSIKDVLMCFLGSLTSCFIIQPLVNKSH